ncbi:cyclic nucleotide-binding domain-containing protein [Sporosalibacterium faouarense]|uniref:cyclic nucleotide-binding domain-containing protein n=1 Tax=Sporosalibacterium faouarense TaxID=516123 RepID=UPI00192BD354|nr:cyclic nucleotide-binding domain-containing protein [Sporosalibacterium faouarense]
MIKVNNLRIMNYYIKKHKIDEIFSRDMSNFMELFLFKKGEHICKETDEIKNIFFFVEGKAKVYVTLSNGKSLLLCFYDSFRILGDVEVAGIKKASTNVQVIEDSYCIGISMERAKKYLLNDAKFLRIICNSLGKKLNRSSKNSSINLLFPLKNRLSSYILATGKNTGDSSPGKIEFQGNLTEIAELLGTSYRHLLRTLNELVLEGILEKRSKSFRVINEELLRDLAADLYR